VFSPHEECIGLGMQAYKKGLPELYANELRVRIAKVVLRYNTR